MFCVTANGFGYFPLSFKEGGHPPFDPPPNDAASCAIHPIYRKK